MMLLLKTYDGDTRKFLDNLQPDGQMDTPGDIELIIFEQHGPVAWITAIFLLNSERFHNLVQLTHDQGMVWIATATKRGENFQRLIMLSVLQQPAR